ncbi:hypothetical protein RHMOL_Rhmol04G0072200 [Rhododendron molle]|uniref:Uncharacterized protein n=1 Tax=Rhododendron molle TaxID=49168 RepID=A0ACC0P042_RHOML|nr:hypothetical protein RHMOL_Rhmol04G0072200 [Rhododendron molle]
MQAWIREHFPMFRHARDPSYTDDLPLATHWLSRRETIMETTYHYRGMLDDLRPSQVIFEPYTDRRQVVADVVFYTGCIHAMAVLEPYLPDRVLRQFGMVQLVPGPPLVPLRGSRGGNSHSYSVVYVYTDGQWENWRDHVINADKRVPIQLGVPWESHPDYLPWFSKTQKDGEECGFFCWYEPSIWQERSDLGPMKVQINAKDLTTVEQQCESLASMNISEEMEMKIEAMQKEIHELYARKEFRNKGQMN